MSKEILNRRILEVSNYIKAIAQENENNEYENYRNNTTLLKSEVVRLNELIYLIEADKDSNSGVKKEDYKQYSVCITILKAFPEQHFRDVEEFEIVAKDNEEAYKKAQNIAKKITNTRITDEVVIIEGIQVKSVVNECDG
ncbi:MAG: hypothetical protein RR623_07555 [Bacilli bacterium]